MSTDSTHKEAEACPLLRSLTPRSRGLTPLRSRSPRSLSRLPGFACPLRNIVNVADELLILAILVNEIRNGECGIELIEHYSGTKIATCAPHCIRFATNIEGGQKTDRRCCRTCADLNPVPRQIVRERSSNEPLDPRRMNVIRNARAVLSHERRFTRSLWEYDVVESAGLHAEDLRAPAVRLLLERRLQPAV